MPGDLFVVEENMRVPCDAALLSGELLINESSFTGESLPVPKRPLTQGLAQEARFEFTKSRQSVLLEGTNVLRVKPIERPEVLALALRTGFTSYKGQMFRKVLYRRPQTLRFMK